MFGLHESHLPVGLACVLAQAEVGLLDYIDGWYKRIASLEAWKSTESELWTAVICKKIDHF